MSPQSKKKSSKEKKSGSFPPVQRDPHSDWSEDPFYSSTNYDQVVSGFPRLDLNQNPQEHPPPTPQQHADDHSSQESYIQPQIQGNSMQGSYPVDTYHQQTYGDSQYNYEQMQRVMAESRKNHQAAQRGGDGQSSSQAQAVNEYVASPAGTITPTQAGYGGNTSDITAGGQGYGGEGEDEEEDASGEQDEEEKKRKSRKRKGKEKASHSSQNRGPRDYEDDDNPGATGHHQTAMGGGQYTGSFNYDNGDGQTDSDVYKASYTNDSQNDGSADTLDPDEATATYDNTVYRPMIFTRANKKDNYRYVGFLDTVCTVGNLISHSLVKELRRENNTKHCSGQWAATSLGVFELTKREIELEWWDCDAEKSRKTLFLIWKKPPPETDIPFEVLLGAGWTSRHASASSKGSRK